MNKLVKSLLVVAGVTVAGFASAQTSPAETAGLCAGNAYKLFQYGQQTNNQQMINLAREKMGRLYSLYGNQPGYKEGNGYSVTRNDSIETRAKVFDGCTKQGF